MARKLIIENILNLIKGIGGNPNKFMGTKTNISFLGRGPQEGLFQGQIDVGGMVQSGFPLRKVIAEAEKAGGYVTSGKLNDLQLQRLQTNLTQLKQAYKPEPLANITDMATGTRNLDAEGIMALRSGFNPKAPGYIRQGDPITAENFGASQFAPTKRALERFPKETHKFMGRPLKEKDFAEIDKLVAEGRLPLGPVGRVELAEKTHSARAALLRMLDATPTGKEGVGMTLREAMSPQEVKWVLEGGGGADGNPIALIAKYFGPVVSRNIPVKGTPGAIEEFIKKVMRLKDRQGRGVEDPFFSKTELDFAHGGLARILEI